jgi:thiol-disulfide isomerase/thioredoxin
MVDIKTEPLINYLVPNLYEKIIVVFGNRTCTACKKVTSIFIPLFELAYDDILFYFLDADKFSKTADEFKIEFYPTLVLFENGVETKRIISTSITEITNHLLK